MKVYNDPELNIYNAEFEVITDEDDLPPDSGVQFG